MELKELTSSEVEELAKVGNSDQRGGASGGFGAGEFALLVEGEDFTLADGPAVADLGGRELVLGA